MEPRALQHTDGTHVGAPQGRYLAREDVTPERGWQKSDVGGGLIRRRILWATQGSNAVCARRSDLVPPIV